MKVLITGGLGFIGSHLTQHLLEQGNEVCIIDQIENQALSDTFASYQRYSAIRGRVEEEDVMRELVASCDVVIHLAATLGVRTCVENPAEIIEGNLFPTLTTLKFAKKFNKKVVFASTSEVYGKSEAIPFVESGDRLLGATSTHRWSYSTVKALEEHLFLAASKEGLPVTIVRYFNAYGARAKAGMYGGVVPKFIVAALQNKPLTVYGDGKQSRCFTYVVDSVKATTKAIEAHCNGQVINIGSNMELTIEQLAHKIIKLTNSRSPIHYLSHDQAFGDGFEEMRMRKPSTVKMEQYLGMKAETSIDEGLYETISWYRSFL